MDKAALTRIWIFAACDVVKLTGEEPDVNNICEHLPERYNPQCREYYVACWRKLNQGGGAENPQQILEQQNREIEKLKLELEQLKLQVPQSNQDVNITGTSVNNQPIQNVNVEKEKVEINIGDYIINRWDIKRFESGRGSRIFKNRLERLTQWLNEENKKILSEKQLGEKLKLTRVELMQTHKKLESRGCKITQLPNNKFEYDFTEWQYDE